MGRLIAAGTVAFVVVFGTSLVVKVRAGTGPDTSGLSAAQIQDVVGLASRAAVGVSAVTCAGTMGGTGFVVDARVVTNHHLVQGATVMEVRAPRRDRVAVAVDAVAPGVDLARSAPGEGWGDPGSDDAGQTASGLVLASGDPAVGEPVVVFGWSNGQLRWLEARVHLFLAGPGYGVEGPVLLLDRAVDRGWSGGPVLDRRGEVVGMVRAVDLATGLTAAVPVSEIEEWLKTDTDVHADSTCVD